MTQKLRAAVVGAGVFGRNHLRVYRDLEEVELVAVVDASAENCDRLAQEYSIPGFRSVEALLQSAVGVDCASICVPTVHHANVAEQLLDAGIDVLIEKPFAASLAEADRVLQLAATKGRIVQIGHLERFNPAVTATLPLITKPMFFESHRLSIFTPRSLDVDVVLDLMIHDLDVVLSMVRSDGIEVRAVGLPVLSPKVDIANVRVEFANGCVANFTASRVSTERVRKLRFFQPHQYVSLDFARQDLLMIDVADAAGKMAALAGLSPDKLAEVMASAAAHPSAGLSIRNMPVEAGEPLRLEIASFLDAVRNRTTPRVSGEQGRAALDLALTINRMIAEHAKRAGLTT